jgi:hypothetical protein
MTEGAKVAVWAIINNTLTGSKITPVQDGPGRAPPKCAKF